MGGRLRVLCRESDQSGSVNGGKSVGEEEILIVTVGMTRFALVRLEKKGVVGSSRFMVVRGEGKKEGTSHALASSTGGVIKPRHSHW